MDYHPAQMYHWDFWMIEHAGRVHSFYLFRLRAGAVADPERLGWLGHAVSDDLITWREEPLVLPTGPHGSLDDLKHWTGHIIEKDGLFYNFYTGRSSVEDGNVQRTMVATSPDLYAWTTYAHNPVIEADARWYNVERTLATKNRVGWRDPRVVLDAQTGWYYAFIAADLPEGELAERGCVARARSRDLLHWEVMPPAFAPRKYGTIEVPDVFALDGRWYLILLTGTNYGNPRGTFSDPHVGMGTIYAVADSLDGEFRELDDNVLIGARWWEGTSCRTVEFGGTRYLFYFQCEREGGHDGGVFNWGRLTTPKELRTTPEGYLRAVYSPLIERRATGPLLAGFPAELAEPERQYGLGRWAIAADGATGACRSGWSSAITAAQGANFILTCAVTGLAGRAAGVAFHAVNPADTYAVLLDYEQQMIFLTQLREFGVLQARTARLAHGETYRIRVVAKGEFYEIYLDDVLMINCVRYALPEGHFGLVVEKAEAEFRDFAAVGLDIGR